MKNKIQTAYKKSPVFIQNLLISAYGFYWKSRRLGGVFKTHVNEFKRREKFTKDQWREYQTKELRKLLAHAFDTVPYYKKLYAEHGFGPEDFKKFEIEDLKKLPCLEKEELRKYGTTTLLSTKRKKGTFLSSSGSTGTPIKAFFTKEAHQIWSAAYEARIRNWAGVDHTMSRGMIGGRRILPDADAKPPYFRKNYAEKQVYFSAYHLSPETASNYLKGIKDSQLDYMVGYAMSNYLLAEFIEKKELQAPKLKAVLTSSEKLTQEMRSTMERVYNCKVYDAYSGVESCGLISENSHGELLFSPDTGIMEVVDDEGKDVAHGDAGEVISTGLLNFDQPLIRYRIGDRVKLSKNQETVSGLHMPKIDEIEGRTEDVVTAKDGRKMVRFHGLFVDIPKLVVAQLIQNTTEDYTINVVVEDGFSRLEEEEMKKRLCSQVGEVSVQFNQLKEIPRNKNGKFRAVISKVP
ncbi:phenylacetate--CoA ligase family protein [Flagellimonas aequoris]|uniref:Phenylacetate--CoA ligase family protein n=1 Tax=Flagellimonas aequoris TaxID=2306997 RepID=A0A418N9L2_9FLAO|nr:phenylacetate--CoA ligase family protein [Allomuricauda aequoris]RIV72559.1 phenylacetate--CoA ligase family protein [Allomuricauda aequoris]TXK05059.1 phenylacetate--CoA ligase family protein [Allomuricauda aequoris]